MPCHTPTSWDGRATSTKSGYLTFGCFNSPQVLLFAHMDKISTNVFPLSHRLWPAIEDLASFGTVAWSSYEIWIGPYLSCSSQGRYITSKARVSMLNHLNGMIHILFLFFFLSGPEVAVIIPSSSRQYSCIPSIPLSSPAHSSPIDCLSPIILNQAHFY